ncbi:hypothetical protein LOTGIDRAFT_228392 [Lottia gigantea]|uniref:Sulfatase N-terminal domain-containing protein n=1 Tax=Lottia gigantea TaxID=225164 RepID=V4AL75_LOTGI|nr:hypothetical protein LOTGIDRAFT_228392 [Lottia gigantea]ESO97852.1 hypothetical protein LOTGIDRAFT_228392 [Lottia gigantea]
MAKCSLDTCRWTMLYLAISLLILVSDAKNVVVMFGDDAGIQMGAYNNPVCKTPNIDALAANGVTFRHGFTSVSSCSPSRSALLTGLPQHQNGIYGLASGRFHFSSFDNVISLPKILGDNGIRTGIIGKYHVQPESVYTFDFMETESTNDMNQIGRNITFMNYQVERFLSSYGDKPFFLYIAFHDVHRCRSPEPYGTFCERFGDPTKSNGSIPDWKPDYYDPKDVMLEKYVPDKPAARQDLANLYTITGRMEKSDALVSTTDVVPTVLDWFDIQYPSWKLFGQNVKLTGNSLLPALSNVESGGYGHVFASHNLHEATMYYPMRVLRTKDLRLIHNLNYMAPYPMAEDVFNSPTFMELLNNTEAGLNTGWIRFLEDYYFRHEFELFNVTSDPSELVNLAEDPSYYNILNGLKSKLSSWQETTGDIWRCEPRGILEANGNCISADNHLIRKYAAKLRCNVNTCQ